MSAAIYYRLRCALERARLAEGLSRADLAKQLHRPPEFVTAYETGLLTLKVEDLLLVASKLKLNASKLLGTADAAENNGHVPGAS